jgi:hypothetical protein
MAEWYTGKLAGYGLIPEADGPVAAVTFLERERAVTLTARDAGWPVITIDRGADLAPAENLRTAQQALSQQVHTVGHRPRPQWRGRSARQRARLRMAGALQSLTIPILHAPLISATN